jgi:hypothetical protein
MNERAEEVNLGHENFRDEAKLRSPSRNDIEEVKKEEKPQPKAFYDDWESFKVDPAIIQKTTSHQMSSEKDKS